MGTSVREKRRLPLFKAIYDRLAHISHIDGCIWVFSGGSPPFCYIFTGFVSRKSQIFSNTHCSSVVRPWLHDLKVLGSNPIEAPMFLLFLPFQIERLRDSLNALLRNSTDRPWEPQQEAQSSK